MSEIQCVNLMEEFGERYRVTFDPAYDPKNRPREKLDAWYMQIPCERGTIYPWSEDRLAVEVDHRPITAKKLAALDDVVLVQDGDNEKTFAFPLSMFDAVAELVLPRRKRRLTDDQKQKAGERLKAYQFQPRGPDAPRRAPRAASTSP